MFRDMKLKMKLSLGFASVTALLVIVAATGIYAISNAGSGFQSYRELARDSVLCGRLQANMLLTRIQVKNFVISDDLAAVKSYEARFAKTSEFVAAAKQEIRNPERAKSVARIDELLVQYDDAFKQTIEQQTLRNSLMTAELNNHGPKMESILTSVLAASREYENTHTAFYAGSALRDLLMARIHVAKYANTNSKNDRDQVIIEFIKMDKALAAASDKLRNEEERSAIAKVNDLRSRYVNAFKSYVSATDARNDLVTQTLDRIGPEISDYAENIKLSVKSDQDALGPVVQAGNRKASLLIFVVSFTALLSAVAVTIALSRMITRPIIALVEAMQLADSNNDLTIQIPEAGNDEVGIMASSFNRFVSSLRETITVVANSSTAVSSASVQLDQTARSLTDGAGTTSSNSAQVAAVSKTMNSEIGTIAQSTEEMSTNVRAVATAMDQMSESIREIAGNTAEASAVACDASNLAEQSQSQVGQLHSSADEIGKVIGVIQEIAEQTKLLALNATIEAARAGEAGQGFAVVASEVKQLAKQTADATEHIRHQVSEMQTSTGDVVASIEKISHAIQQVNNVSTSIASAVEEQSVTSEEISRNMNETSRATEEVTAGVLRNAESTNALSSSIAEVDQAARYTADGAEQTRAAGNDLSHLAVELRDLVGKFRIA